METLEIHSKSFLIKWVNAPNNSTITWQVKPLKKSINVGLFRHTSQEDSNNFVLEDFNITGDSPKKHQNNNNGTIEERLAKSGLDKVCWHGRCTSDEQVQGQHDVEDGQGGIFALVFDNTFSKNTAKTVLFSQNVLSKKTKLKVQISEPQVQSVQDSSHSGSTCVSDGRYLSGIMLKKRRKRMQGFARRYFSLDYKYGILNYYLGQKSSFLRGSMQMNVCAITANKHTRDIIIDSGVELWHLRALSERDFNTWTSAVGAAKHTSLSDYNTAHAVLGNLLSPTSSILASRSAFSIANNNEDSSNWSQIADLVSKLESLSSTANKLGNPFDEEDLNISQLSLGDGTVVGTPSTTPSSTDVPQRRPSFWKKRPPKSPRSSSVNSKNNSAVSSSLSINGMVKSPLINARNELEFQNMVSQLSQLTTEFKGVLNKHKEFVNHRIQQQPPSRISFDGSVISEEFFDAIEEFEEEEGIVYFDLEEDEGENKSAEEEEVDDNFENSYSSSDEEYEQIPQVHEPITNKHDLYPLPFGQIERRTTIPDAAEPAPGLLGILRKNVGKDLSNVTMPVASNEPLSYLERTCEPMEYSYLLDKAAKTTDHCELALLIGCVVIAACSSARAKERQRKPFNPLLGETYELVREDYGFRLISEKISHRPLIMATEAESDDWIFQYACQPCQKYWGKSAEIYDAGSYRVTIKKTGEIIEFKTPSMFLRNLYAGEKYLEPVGKVTVRSSSGATSTVEYKPSAGMFSGRSEEVVITATDATGNMYPYRYEGKWTEKLYAIQPDGTKLSDEPIWVPGELAEGYRKKFGYSKFDCTLNEITDVELGYIPKTDSRLRPDLRQYEQGNVKMAEKLKLELEECQRQRRAQMEKNNQIWKPVFFEKARDNPEVYVLKDGDENYWNRRKNGDWKGLIDLW